MPSSVLHVVNGACTETCKIPSNYAKDFSFS